MVVRTEAVTLRSVDYGETSQIVTLFSRSHGRITVMAKGSRSGRTRFGSTLQPMAHIQALLYYRSGRSVHTLTETSNVSVWRNMVRDVAKLEIGLRIVELINALLLDDDPHERLFDEVVAILARLDAEHERPSNSWPYFQMQLARALGFSPAFEREEIESVSETAVLSLADGRIGGAESGGAMRVDRSVLRAFAIMARSDLDTAMRLRLDKRVGPRLDHLVESYLRYHVERAYPQRAAAVMGQLKRVGMNRDLPDRPF